MNENIVDQIVVEAILKTDEFKKKLDTAVDGAVKSFRDGFDAIEKKGTTVLDKLGAKAGEFAGKAGQAIKRGAEVGVIALVGLGIASVKLASDFEQSFSEVATLLPQLDKGEIAKLRQDTLDFSRDMGIAVDKVVPALYQAISAGVPSDNVFDFMEVASKAAIGGVTDLETAVDGITSAVNAYGAENLSAQQAADFMFTTVKLGKTNFEQLSRSMFNVLPTASSLGIGLDEVSAALATMTLQGVPTSVATTSLRQALVEAAKGGSELDGAIRGLTGQSFGELIASGRGGVEILQELRESMPEQEFKDLFGSVEGMNAVLQITGDNFENFNSNLDAMGTSAGAVDAAFGTVAEGANFKLNKALNSLKVTMIEIGLVVLPYIAAALDRFSAWLAGHQDDIDRFIRAFADFMESDVIPMIGAAFAQLEQTIEGFMRVAGPVIDWLREHKEVALALGLVVLGLAAVFGGPIVTIVALTTAGTLLLANWDAIRDKAEELLDKLLDIPVVGKVVRIAFDLIASRVKNLVAFIGDLVTIGKEVVSFFKNVFKGDLGAAWKDLGDIGKAALQGFVHWIKTTFLGDLLILIKQLGPQVANAALDGLQALPGALAKGAELALQGFVDGAEAAWPIVLDFFEKLPGRIVDGIEALAPVLAAAGMAGLAGMVEGFEAAWPVVASWLGDVPGLIVSAAGDLAPVLVDAGKALIEGLIAGAEALWHTRDWIVKRLPGEVIKLVGDLAPVLLDAGEALIEGLWAGAEMAFEVGSQFLIDLPGNVLDLLGDLAPVLLDAGELLLTGLWEGAKLYFEAQKFFWLDLVPTIAGFIIDEAPGALLSAGEAILTGLWEGAKIGWELHNDFWFNLPSTIVGAVGDLLETLSQAGQDLLQGLIDGAEELWDREKKFFTGLPGNIQDAITGIGTGALGMLFGIGQDILQGLINGIVEGAEAKVIAVANQLWEWIPGWIKTFFGIGSPASGMIPLGEAMMEGIAVGVTRGAGVVSAAVLSAGDAIFGASQTALEGIVKNWQAHAISLSDVAVAASLGLDSLAEALLQMLAGMDSGREVMRQLQEQLALLDGLIAQVDETTGAVAETVLYTVAQYELLAAVLERAAEGELSIGDALLLNQAGFEAAALAVAQYTAGLITLDEALAVIEGAFTAVATSAEVLGEQFATSFADALANQEMLDLVGSSGVKLLDQLNLVLTVGGEKNVQTLASMAVAMLTKLQESLPPDEAEELGAVFMDALNLAIETGGQEGIDLLIGLLEEMDQAIEDGTTEVLSAVDKFNADLKKNFKDAALEKEVGKQGKSLMDALAKAIETGGEAGVEAMADVSFDILNKLEDLDNAKADMLGANLMAALQHALEDGGADAIAAVQAILAEINGLIAQTEQFPGEPPPGQPPDTPPVGSILIDPSNLTVAQAKAKGLLGGASAYTYLFNTGAWADSQQMIGMTVGKAVKTVNDHYATLGSAAQAAVLANLQKDSKLLAFLRSNGLSFREGGMIGPGVETLAMLHGGRSGEAVVAFDRLESALAHALREVMGDEWSGGGGGGDTNYGKIYHINGDRGSAAENLRSLDRMVR